jgi:hypothetical protein
MRYFPVLDFQHVVLLLFLGSIFFIALFVAFSAYRWRARDRASREETEEYPEGIKVGNKRIPPILICIYLAFFAWVLGYWLVIGLIKGPF